MGEKRIGVARADSSTRIAVPIGFINVDGSEWQRIAHLSKIHSTLFFVVGLPRSNEGNETKQSVYARRFAKTLTEKVPGARVRFQDESLTSVVAEERLKSRRKVYEKGEVDAEAAAIILQDFLENFTRKTTPKPLPPDAQRGGIGISAKPTALETISGQPLEPANVKNLAKKEADKVKLKSKKAKHKMSGVVRGMSVVIIALIVAGAATAGVFWYKNYRDEERAKYYAEMEAEMNANATFEFTIRPGETIYEVKAALIEQGYSETEVTEAFASDYDFEFLKGRPEGATLEGYLFGETYEFYKTDSVKDILTKYLEGTGEMIAENDLVAKYTARGLSLYEGITLASIVQSESGNLTSEMPTVAQVFYSRLENGTPLGSDVTVSYALDTVDPDRQAYTDNQAALQVESCYNTRVNNGLPCGPISNPGLEALLAVAEPADTSYLYFLTGDDGLMYYSSTEDEHLQNIAAHCQDLCEISL